jgi:hypothetical protein
MREWRGLGSLFVDADRLPGDGTDYGVAGFLFVVRVEVTRHFVAHEVGKSFHLRLHLGHFVAHVQDDFDAGKIYAEFASQVEDDFEPFEIFVRVEAGVALGARRLEQADALVEATIIAVPVIRYAALL